MSAAILAAQHWLQNHSKVLATLRWNRYYQCNYLPALFTLDFTALPSLEGACSELDAEQDKIYPFPNHSMQAPEPVISTTFSNMTRSSFWKL